jgi:hypothetical protein
MARKKPIEVDEVHYATLGVRVKIFLNREKNKFYADYAGEHFEHAECAQVKRLVLDSIQASQKLDWIPVIEIEKLLPFSADTPENFIGFSLDRFYIAYTTGGRIVRTRWFVDGEGVDVPLSVYRKSIEGRVKGANAANDMAFVETFLWDEERAGKFRLPYPYEGCQGTDSGEDWRSEQTVYVRYSPELWRGLELILERIEEMRRKLDELLLSPEGHKLIEGLVAQLSLSGPALALKGEVGAAGRSTGGEAGGE